MAWKDLSYWLKGAVIGFIIAIIIWVIYILNFQLFTCSAGFGAWQEPLPNYCYLLFPINGSVSGISGVLNFFLFPLLVALMGWLVRKVKSN